MAIYTVSDDFPGINTAARAVAVLKAGANRRLRVYRVSMFCWVVSTNALQLYIVRQTVAGTTPGASFTPQALDPNDVAADARLETGGYAGQPTLSTATPLDTGSIPLTAGAGIVWSFPTPIEVAAGTANGIAIYSVNASGATTGTYSASFLYEE